ncbi:MAG: molybdenum cofactor biosynthesis protein B [Isosphaeraceae bacterium]|jgi:molybdenum cofactor biosynthesis protein B|nr:MAG: molybdenum cofactor biosynthesis protein B [Isosphaeraceae bacterium]
MPFLFSSSGMTDPVSSHRSQAPATIRLAVLTVSDTRTIETDTSGARIVELATAADMLIAARAIVPDDPARIRPQLEAWRDDPGIDAVLVTGGTGVSPRDQTVETVAALLTQPLPGFGELFRMLSYAEIGPAAMLSRACGGLMGRTPIFLMPGSRAAVSLALERLILPELGHLLGQIGRPN